MLWLLFRALLFSLGAFGYANLNVLSQLSKDSDGKYPYSMPTVVMCAEFVKLIISSGFLMREQGSPSKAFGVVASSPIRTWLLFAVPSVLYAINNNLDMMNNLYMDPATESVLVQGKVLTTGLAWRFVFKEELGTLKWTALVLLMIGCSLAGWPTESGTSSMYIEPFGLVLVSIHCCCSAAAGVINEWLYKGLGKDESIHVSNIRIYVVGVIFCLATHLMTHESRQEGFWQNFFHGYNVYAVVMIFNLSMLGLLLAQIMKYFNSIVKLFISGSSMYAAAFLTVTIFGRMPSVAFSVALVFVTSALLLYNHDRIAVLFQDGGTKEAKQK